jgi:uncharacterized protein (TIGR00369 family)
MADDAPAPLFPDSPAELPDPADLAGLSGLEVMRRIRDGELPAAPIARLLRFHLHEVEEGRAAFRGEPFFGAFNPIGSMHGGWYGTLLDSAMGCAVHTTLPPGRAYTTLEYKVTLLRAVPLDAGPVLAEGWTVRTGRRTAAAEGRIVGEADGKLYATGSTTCLVFEAG